MVAREGSRLWRLRPQWFGMQFSQVIKHCYPLDWYRDDAIFLQTKLNMRIMDSPSNNPISTIDSKYRKSFEINVCIPDYTGSAFQLQQAARSCYDFVTSYETLSIAVIPVNNRMYCYQAAFQLSQMT